MNIIINENTYQSIQGQINERKSDVEAYEHSWEIFQMVYGKLSKLTDNGTLSDEEVLDRISNTRGIFDFTNGLALMFSKGTINYPNNLRINIVQDGHRRGGMAKRENNVDNIYIYTGKSNNFYSNVAKLFYDNRKMFAHEFKHLLDLNKSHKIWKGYIDPPEDGNGMGMRRYYLQNAEMSAIFNEVMYGVIESVINSFKIHKDEWNDDEIRQSNIEWYEENLGRKLSDEEAYQVHLASSSVCGIDYLVSNFYSKLKKRLDGFVPKRLQKKLKGRAYTVFELLIERLGIDCSKQIKY